MTNVLGNIFLGCFLLGFILTAASLLFGMDSHSPQAGDPGGPGHAPTGIDVAGDPTGAGAQHAQHHGFKGIPFLNYNTIVMFLTWFGAAGFLLTISGTFGTIGIMAGAVTAGLAGAVVVFLFINKFLMNAETRMDPTDYYMPGTLARVTSTIREGGTGEIMYVQGGTRKTAGARSDEPGAHRQGEEVVIVRYEKGMAYVRAIQKDFEFAPGEQVRSS